MTLQKGQQLNEGQNKADYISLRHYEYGDCFFIEKKAKLGKQYLVKKQPKGFLSFSEVAIKQRKEGTQFEIFLVGKTF